MASSSLWGALAANVASYGKDLTQDIRDIVSGADDEHIVEKNESVEVTGQDEDLSAYIEDLERSLIRKKQESEAAYKMIEELEVRLSERRETAKLLVDDTAVSEAQRQLQAVLSQQKQDKARHAIEMHDALASFDAKLAAATQEAHRWRVESERLRASSTLKVAEDTTPNDLPSSESTRASVETHPDVVDAAALLASVLHADDLIEDGPRKLTHYASLVSSRLVAAEVDAKALQNALTTFLVAQGDSVDQPVSLAECKLKLDQIGIARRMEQQRLAELDHATSQFQRDLTEVTAKLQALEQRHKKESQDQEDKYRHLHDKLAQSQANANHLSTELEATTCELQELQATVAMQRDTDDLVERNMELERMLYTVKDELAQVKSQLTLERAQWVQHERANTSAISEAQWFELKSNLALVEADKNVAEQDAERLQTELLNLHAVLTQFQSSREAEEMQWRAKEATWTSKCDTLEAEVAAARMRQTSIEDVDVLMQSMAKKDLEIERLRNVRFQDANDARGSQLVMTRR
ncbi:hypothetical protein H310_06671 [Aphanomyces invadans]|uniref:Uncharacterized protein n=1 Tax=Aphanomyces invadans TaxID=157072 RepID=A0A024U486_9STRA|nr:hypothetical protein H310_06671 [Aphanomyces invadans]ETW01040.1 hypothetical protein H310_06671 [Aphanomyces invadans]|eukprot:XP_008870038.1 hypothetical protein H310_06671 [Aphanomyces invadans]